MNFFKPNGLDFNDVVLIRSSSESNCYIGIGYVNSFSSKDVPSFDPNSDLVGVMLEEGTLISASLLVKTGYKLVIDEPYSIQVKVADDEGFVVEN